MPQRLLKTKYLFIADRSESAVFHCGWVESPFDVSLCSRSLSQKSFKPQRTQRGTEETSNCVPIGTAASFAFKTFLEFLDSSQNF